MHTPEQAKDLWCPMVRASNGNDQPANAGNSEAYRTPPFARCIGDKCAMWRWADTPSDIYRVRVMCNQFDAEIEPARPAGMNPTLVFEPYVPGDDCCACWVEPETTWLARRRGFCGLAGTPGGAAA